MSVVQVPALRRVRYPFVWYPTRRPALRHKLHRRGATHMEAAARAHRGQFREALNWLNRGAW